MLACKMVADEQEFVIEFGKRIAMRRKDRGYSQEELANLSGLHRTAISLIETGKRAVQLRTVYQLAVALGYHPSDLMPEVRKFLPEKLPRPNKKKRSKSV